MAEKKRSAKAKIAKEDEEVINKRITVGAVLTLVFLILFLFTQLEPREEVLITFDDYSPEEKIQETQRSQQEIIDATNYQRALSLQNQIYCDEIQNEALRQKCISQVPEREERAPVEEKSSTQIQDQTNYQRALTFQNSVYCDLISDETTREDCRAALAG